jgi:hypothetical protein
MWGEVSLLNGDKNGGKLRTVVAKQMTSPQLEIAQNSRER